jgi:uncharacterized membrane protein YeaQ/YmgE (transglycosylase-associated protein family)
MEVVGMGVVAWITIGSALGVTFAALYRSAPPGGRALVVLVGALGGAVGDLIGTAASAVSIKTLFAVAPWLTAVLGALAAVGLHNVGTGDARAARSHEHKPWTP